ncbi:MAG: MFS transporter [Chloroflexi bacterium]|nr:MFS transporter [Chloroflexota bacterium]HOA25056.1 MFS transporter [Aggregatilineales bacterium]
MTSKRAITTVFFISFVALGMTVPLLGVTVQDLAARFGVAIENAGQFQTAMSFGGVVSSLVAGRLYDRMNARRLLPLGSGLIAISMLGLYLSTSQLAGLLSAFAMGVGFSVYLLGPNVIITRLNAGNAAGPLSALNFTYGVGAILAPQLVTLGTLLAEVRIAYLITGGMMALLTIPMALVDVPPPVTATEEGSRAPRVNWLHLLPFVVLFYCAMGIEVSFNTWVVTQGQLVARVPLTTANFAASIFWIGYTLSRGAAAWIGRRMTSLHLLISAIGVMIAGYILMLAVPASPAVFIASALIIGIGTGPLFPASLATTGEAFPLVMGQVTGLLTAAGNFGPTTLPLLQGRVGGGQSGGMSLLLAFSGVMLLAALAVQRYKPGMLGVRLAPQPAPVDD